MALTFRLTFRPFLAKVYRPSVSSRCFHKGATLSAASQEDPLTIREQKDGIRTITLNNPKKRNALSLAMLESLHSDLITDAESSDLRVIVIKHLGSVFSAGHDLTELKTNTGKEFHEKVFAQCTRVMSLVQDLPVPVITQVNGLATAAGCQLVASSDIAVVTESSRFATPGVSVGLFCSTPGVAVARAVPRKVAMEMLFTGHPINAQDALRHGLVSKVVPEDQLDNEVDKIAKRICETSRSVTALGKNFFYRQVALNRDQAYSEAERVMVDNLRFNDAQEGISAFKEKRHPMWDHTTDKAH